MEKTKIHIPLTVPKNKISEYLKNYHIGTRGTGRLYMFACDQKVEHMNDDFFARGITPEMADPEHFFKIAAGSNVGAMATQLGLIAQYGRNYSHIPYIIKLNSKTNLLKTDEKDPYANLWHSMDEVMDFKRSSRLHIIGVGYTIYIGSWYESDMFRQAAHMVYRAHKEGLLTVLWVYPRGKAITNERDPHIIAGGAGVACTLGADFVKLNYPKKDSKKSSELLKESVVAAGRTGVICVGGSKKPAREFLQDVYDQIHISGSRGAAIGRNIFQRPLDEAIRMSSAVSAIIYHDTPVPRAYKIFISGAKP